MGWGDGVGVKAPLVFLVCGRTPSLSSKWSEHRAGDSGVLPEHCGETSPCTLKIKQKGFKNVECKAPPVSLCLAILPLTLTGTSSALIFHLSSEVSTPEELEEQNQGEGGGTGRSSEPSWCLVYSSAPISAAVASSLPPTGSRHPAPPVLTAFLTARSNERSGHMSWFRDSLLSTVSGTNDQCTGLTSGTLLRLTRQ